MGAMPGMGSDEEDAPKGKGVDLAIIMGGKGKPGDKPSAKAEPDGESEDELPPGFEEAFSEAFPDAAGDKDRMLAVKRLIHLCADSY